MTPEEIAATYCQSAGCEVMGHHRDCSLAKIITQAVAQARAEERDWMLRVIAGGDRPWQELAEIIRARAAAEGRDLRAADKGELRKRIASFSELKKDWDSYGANPLNKATVAFALAMVDYLPPGFWNVFPTIDESIQFEDGARDIEVYAHEEEEGQ